jgi:hypothetical protein
MNRSLIIVAAAVGIALAAPAQAATFDHTLDGAVPAGARVQLARWHHDRHHWHHHHHHRGWYGFAYSPRHWHCWYVHRWHHHHRVLVRRCGW